jgi:ribonuclease P protein component
MNAKFPRELKLLKTDEFSSVFSFRKRIASPTLVLHYQPNQLGHPRMGLVVSKKIARLSVSRNYMRRVLRELFRKNKSNFKAIDFIIRPQKSFCAKNYDEIVQEFDMLVGKLNKK